MNESYLSKSNAEKNGALTRSLLLEAEKELIEE
jgi:hypothetical protein